MKKEIIRRKDYVYDCQIAKCQHHFIGTKDDVQCPSCDSFNIKLREVRGNESLLQKERKI